MRSRREVLTRTLVRVTPGLLYIPMAVWLIRAGDAAPAWAVLAVLAFGLGAIAVALPTAARRVRGWLTLPSLRALLNEATVEFERGTPERVIERLHAMAVQIDGKLDAYRYLVLHVLGYAEIACGQRERGLARLDQLETSGWLDALPIRRMRSGLIGGQVSIRAQCGDVAGARRLAERLAPNDHDYLSDVARALLSVREGSSDAIAALEAVLSRATPEGRSSQARLARLALLSLLPEGDPRVAQQAEVLRAQGRRPFRVLHECWPALYAVAEREGIVGPVA
jgi:hypothetical protein